MHGASEQMSLRVVLITIEEPFYMPEVVHQLLLARTAEVQLVVALPPVAGKRTTTSVAREQLALYGVWRFLIKSASYVGRRTIDRLPDWLASNPAYSVRRAAERFGVPCITPRSINEPGFLTRMQELAPDVVVSLGSPQIFRRELLRVPRLGCINVHNGPLPRYRGMMPSFWVLYHGERQTAVTVHFMDERLDSGKIIVQRPVPLTSNDTLDSVIRRTKGIAADVIGEALLKLEEGECVTLENDPAKATYFSFPTAAEANQFRAMGRRFS
jgi:methionyl-tRNA formyltransferase